MDFIGQHPVKADFARIVRQIQQLPAPRQIGAKRPVDNRVKRELLCLSQQLIQLFKADLPLQGRKIKVLKKPRNRLVAGFF